MGKSKVNVPVSPKDDDSVLWAGLTFMNELREGTGGAPIGVVEAKLKSNCVWGPCPLPGPQGGRVGAFCFREETACGEVRRNQAKA